MRVGIEKIGMYAGEAFLDLEELALARNVDPKYVTEELMCEQRTILPSFEDTVTLAVNATKNLTAQGVDLSQVELLIVASESGVDCGKPISTWVHRFGEFSSRCRNFEIKHACYGGTGALKMASFWCMANPNKKAVVVSSDYTRYCLNESWEYVGGGVGIAMLIGSDPQILDLEMNNAGYWTTEVYDTFRPTPELEVMKNETSIFSYLDALDGAFDHYCELTGNDDPLPSLDKHIYHAPFCGMPVIAHKSLLRRMGIAKADIESDFVKKVHKSLTIHRNLGSCYGSSNFVSLLGLLSSDDDLLHKSSRISLFSYGSGCQAEFYSAMIHENAAQQIRQLDLLNKMTQRYKVSVRDYEEIENVRNHNFRVKSFVPDYSQTQELYESKYHGKGRLIIKNITDYERSYQWS